MEALVNLKRKAVLKPNTGLCGTLRGAETNEQGTLLNVP